MGNVTRVVNIGRELLVATIIAVKVISIHSLAGHHNHVNLRLGLVWENSCHLPLPEVGLTDADIILIAGLLYAEDKSLFWNGPLISG